MTDTDFKERVRRANRLVYDGAAGNYEAADGRRERMEGWVRDRLKDLRGRTSGAYLLDIGTGSGFIPRCAEGIFAFTAGTDLSPGILASIKFSGAAYICADAEALPFKDASFDAVTCFAVLHHLYEFEGVVREAARVLKPGGVFYCDHDMDSAFYSRFSIPLAVYRRFRAPEKECSGHNPEISAGDYRLAECHSDGVDSGRIMEFMRREGLQPEPKYHWYGLNPVTDFLFGKRAYPQGFAPLFSCMAVKR